MCTAGVCRARTVYYFMMDGFPDFDEEYEALHAEEMEVLRELEGKAGMVMVERHT